MATGLPLDGRLTVIVLLLELSRLPVHLLVCITKLTSEHSLTSQRQSAATPDGAPEPTGRIAIASTPAHFLVAAGRRAGGVVPLPPLIPFGTALRSYVLIRL